MVRNHCIGFKLIGLNFVKLGIGMGLCFALGWLLIDIDSVSSNTSACTLHKESQILRDEFERSQSKKRY